MATGLMILGKGKSTKLLQQYIGLPKTYVAKIDFSLMTDTWDADFWEKETKYEVREKEGRFFLQKENQLIPSPSLEQIQEKLQYLQTTSPVDLLLPTFSAKKIKGRRLYKAARKGEAPAIKKAMEIYSYQLLEYQFPCLTLSLEVGSGTYIRSIAYWLGQKLAMAGALVALERTSIGEYQLENVGTELCVEGKIKGESRKVYYHILEE